MAKVVDEDDDEWEYEYDGEETESLYFTLDISTHTPPAPNSKKATGPKTLAQKQAENAAKPRARILTASISQPEQRQAPEPAQDDQPGTLQVLDLHTENPIISYNSQFYTCHWATDIGTTLYLTHSPSDLETNESHPPLRSYRSFDLLAKTRARLVAVPAQLKPSAIPLRPSTLNSRRTSATGSVSADEADDQPVPPTAPDSSHYNTQTAEGDTLTYGPNGHLRITVPPNAPETKVNQARFLEKWSELRGKRGRTDWVPVKAVRDYTLPEGWQEERKEWLEKEKRERAERGEGEDAGLELGESTKVLRRRRARRALLDEGEPDEITAAVEASDSTGGKEKAPRKRGPTGRPVGRPKKIQIVEIPDDDPDEDDVEEEEDDDEVSEADDVGASAFQNIGEGVAGPSSMPIILPTNDEQYDM